MKKCSKCQKTEPEVEFYSNDRGLRCKHCKREYGKRYSEIYYAKNTEAVRGKQKVRSKIRYAANREAILAKQRPLTREYARQRRAELKKFPLLQKAFHRKQGAAITARRRTRLFLARESWQLAHPQLALIIEIETAAESAWQRREMRRRHREQNIAWKAENPQRTRLYEARRLGFKAASDHDPRMKEVYRLARSSALVPCYLCGEITRQGERHIEHKTPLSRGGPHTFENVAIACVACNLTKGNKTVEEFKHAA